MTHRWRVSSSLLQTKLAFNGTVWSECSSCICAHITNINHIVQLYFIPKLIQILCSVYVSLLYSTGDSDFIYVCVCIFTTIQVGCLLLWLGLVSVLLEIVHYYCKGWNGEQTDLVTKVCFVLQRATKGNKKVLMWWKLSFSLINYTQVYTCIYNNSFRAKMSGSSKVVWEIYWFAGR